MSSMEITVIVLLVCAVAGWLYSLRVSDQWYKIAQDQNKEWLENALEQNDEWTKFCSKIADERDRLKAKVEELESKAVYTPVICVTSGDGYEEGKIYPLMGSNNGVHILRENQYGDVVDIAFCTGGCGKGLFNNFDDSGCPSFDLVEGDGNA